MKKMTQDVKELNARAGQALTAWMEAREYSDEKLAKELGDVTTSSVFNWRHGTAPRTKSREALEKIIGWKWGEPPSVAAGALMPKRQRTVKEPAPNETHRVIERAPRMTPARAREMIAQLAKGKIGMDTRGTKAALTFALSVIDEKVGAELKTETERRAHEVSDLVTGKLPPDQALGFLRRHSTVDKGVLRAVSRTIKTGGNGAASA